MTQPTPETFRQGVRLLAESPLAAGVVSAAEVEDFAERAFAADDVESGRGVIREWMLFLTRRLQTETKKLRTRQLLDKLRVRSPN